VPGELLIGFRPGLTQADIAAFYVDHGLSEMQNLDLSRDKGVRLVATPRQDDVSLIPTLEQDPRVKYAEPNVILRSAQAPNDPTLSRDFDLINTGQTGGTPDADIDADEAWDITTGSANMVVAVIDTGVDYTHPDLAANMWHNPGEIPGNHKDDDGNGFVDDVYGYDFVNKDGDPMDDNSHGTNVAGIIGMVGNNAIGAAGVNWNAKIMALKTGDADGNFAISDVLEAYNYVILMKTRGVDIRVTNNSYGGFNSFNQSWKDAIDAMGQAGILFVAAAHNQAQDIDTSVDGLRMYPASFDSPNIISVAATDHNDRIASFSNWGATSVDLAAPGEGIWSTVPGNSYAWFNGTSQAAPEVAGAAALVWSAFPNLTAQEVKARLLNSVDYIGDIGANANYPTLTNGRLNVRNALIVPLPDNDSIPPAAISDLAVAGSSPWSITLTWSATGDDGTIGRAAFYDVRYASVPITAATWATATRASAEPAPRPAGAGESFTVTGLEPGSVYYFALKAKDNAGNESGLSNLAQGNTSPAKFLLNDDMESSSASWVATGLWHRSSLRAYDSATAWYYGQDSTGTYFTGAQHSGDLTAASPIDLTGVSHALLRYLEWRQVADFKAPIDVARVQISRNGIDWTTVSEAFEHSLDWEQRTVDLTPFVGGPIYLRFDFNTNPFGFNPQVLIQGYEGWHVDDVQILVMGAQPKGFSVSDVRVVEGNSGTVPATFTITRSSGNGFASVSYLTADGSATVNGGDYQSASGTLVFAPGETRKTVTVWVNGDRLGESDESFVLKLSNPTGAVIADGEGKATILDDEPRIDAEEALVIETDKEMSVQVPVDLTFPSTQIVTVDYTTTDGTATSGSDYLPTAGTLTFSPGETRKSIAITLPRDVTQEAFIEAFFVNLSNVSSNAVILRRGVVLIVDNDKNQGNHFGNASLGSLVLAGINSGSTVVDTSFAINAFPLFGKFEVGATPVVDHAASSSETPKPSALLSTRTSWLPTPAGGSGSGHYLFHNSGQRVSTDWDSGPVADGFVTDLIAQDIVARLKGL
jgi:subtilisin family serine protease